MSVALPLVIGFIPTQIWEAPIPGMEHTWAALYGTQLEFGRKLSKLVDLPTVRRSMLDMIPQVSQGVASLEDCLLLSGGASSTWDALLDRLASERTRRAGERLRRSAMPSFLPFLHASGSGGPAFEAGAYGPVTVSSHIQELKALRFAGDLRTSIDTRLALFQQAAERGCGVIEWKDPHFTSWSASSTEDNR